MADANIIQHLEQPFRIRSLEAETTTAAGLLKTLRCREPLLKMAPVGGALFAKGFVKQALILDEVRILQLFAQLEMGGRHDRIRLKDFNQRVAFAYAELKGDGALIGADPFHASRSIVACSVYFWS